MYGCLATRVRPAHSHHDRSAEASPGGRFRVEDLLPPNFDRLGAIPGESPATPDAALGISVHRSNLGDSTWMPRHARAHRSPITTTQVPRLAPPTLGSERQAIPCRCMQRMAPRDDPGGGSGGAHPGVGQVSESLRSCRSGRTRPTRPARRTRCPRPRASCG